MAASATVAASDLIGGHREDIAVRVLVQHFWAKNVWSCVVRLACGLAPYLGGIVNEHQGSACSDCRRRILLCCCRHVQPCVGCGCKCHSAGQDLLQLTWQRTGSNTSLNAEWVRIKNTGTTNRNLIGWTLRDAQGHTYTFGTYTLKAGTYVTIHTGKGTNTASHRYMQRGRYVWNNTGDKATLRRADGVWIDSCSWSSSGLGYKYC